MQNDGAYAQRYLTGNVTCTQKIRKEKTFDFTVGSDGDKCGKNKEIFCNGKLHGEREYRLVWFGVIRSLRYELHVYATKCVLASRIIHYHAILYTT